MQTIDSHQHFWKYDPDRDAWITDDMKAIKRDFLPQDLQPLLRQNGIDGCLAVQADQSEQETNFLLSLAGEHGFIKGVVGWVDLMAPDLEEKLTHYSRFEKLKGFRHVLQSEPNRDFMLQPDFLRGLSMLNKFNFSYDILIYKDQLSFIPEMVKRFPEQRFVVDHLAKPSVKTGELKEWKEGMENLSCYQQVCCKISGLVTEANWGNWKKEDFIPYLETAVEVFGLKRLMFGSDWPVCLVSASYNEVLAIVQDYFSSFSASEKAQFFGENARSFYRLEQQ